MKLYEFEGHKILNKVGVESPFFVVCENLEEVQAAKKRIKFPIVAKVQVLSGRRGKGGGIKVCTNEKQLVDFCKKMFGSTFNPSASSGQVGEEVRFITLAEKADIEKEFYASITYDTVLAVPFLLFSQEGGMDIEEVRAKNPEEIVRVDINPFLGPDPKLLRKMLTGSYSSSESQIAGRIEKSSGGGSRLRSNNIDYLIDFLMRLWDAFSRYDCRLVEVNPIAKVGESYIAVDAKIILDDAGMARHRDLDVLPKGAAGAVPTKRELAAKKIDVEDYRGNAGSTFIEFGGDIAVLASGGGASLLVMDALVANGGKPSNYTEYSGNPPREKVEKLTKITLSKEGLAGCLVAGAVANFTDIYETLAGFAQGLAEVKPRPSYPIVVRRGGPKQKEAYEMLKKLAKKEGYDFHLFGPETPISVACKKMVELSKEFKSQMANEKSNEILHKVE
ncbi:MAG: ATP-grasp domain-containing protein [Patescibacteria group bacterium]